MYTVSCSLYRWFYGNVCEGQLLCKHCLHCFLNINADLIFDTWQNTDNLSCVLSYISICFIYSSLEYKDIQYVYIYPGKTEFKCVLMKDIIARLLPVSCHVRRVVKTELLVSEWKVWAHLGSCPGQRSQPATPTVPSCRGGGRGAGGLTGCYCQQADRDLRLKPGPNLPCPSGQCHFLQKREKVWFESGKAAC